MAGNLNLIFFITFYSTLTFWTFFPNDLKTCGLNKYGQHLNTYPEAFTCKMSFPTYESHNNYPSDNRHTLRYMKNSSDPTSESLRLKGFVRGHKCLFDDSNISDGNLVYLLRGADASQRLLYPLELVTNNNTLKGADTALKMFESSNQAIDYSIQTIFKQFQEIDPSSYVGELLKEDMHRYHRILQYAIAAGLKDNILRHTALKYNLDLYTEISMNFPALELGVWSLKDFYKSIIEPTKYQQDFLDVWTSLWDQISQMKHFTSENGNILNTKVRKFEEEPEIGTLTPLIVDATNLNLADFPEETRDEMKTFLQSLK